MASNAPIALQGNGGNSNVLPYFNAGEAGYDAQQQRFADQALLGQANPLDGLVVKRQVTMNYFLDRYITPVGMPKGLEPIYTVIDENRFKIELSGKTPFHSSAEDNSIIFKFAKALFTKNLAPQDLSIPVHYIDPILSIKGSFIETESNDGRVSGTVILSIYGGEYIDGVDYNDYINLSNLPTGLTPVFRKEASNMLSVQLSGVAEEHEAEHSVNNMFVNMSEKVLKDPTNIINEQAIKLRFYSPYDPLTKTGGPGQFGNYLTLIAPNHEEIVLSSSGDFGFNGQEHQGTLNLSEVIRRDLNEDELYAIGVEESPQWLSYEKSFGIGLTSVKGAFLVMDSVNAAIDHLQNVREHIAQTVHKIKEAISLMEVTKSNIESVQSNLIETDFAEEMKIFRKEKLLSQAGDFVLSQSSRLQKKQTVRFC